MKRVLRTIGKNFGVNAVRKRYRKIQALKAVAFEKSELLILEQDHMGLPALTVFTEKEVLYYRLTFVAKQSRNTFTAEQKLPNDEINTKSQGE